MIMNDHIAQDQIITKTLKIRKVQIIRKVQMIKKD